MTLKRVYNHPLFVFGIVLRLFIFLIASPKAAVEWYIPFLDLYTSNLTLTPWDSWIETEGAPIAWPYGIVMSTFCAPFIIIAKMVNVPLIYGYFMSIFIADYLILCLLSIFSNFRQTSIYLNYWLSPIILLSGYYLGLNDLIPAMFMLISVYYLQKNIFYVAGIFLAISISTKLSFVIIIPFYLIYLYNNKKYRALSTKFIIGFCVSILLLSLPLILSNHGTEMLFNNPEMDKVYNLAFNLTKEATIFIIPLLYSMLLYRVWRIKRTNFYIFQITIGLSLFIIALLASASPGWFIWSIPIFAIYLIDGDKVTSLLFWIFSCLLVLNKLILNVEISHNYFYFIKNNSDLQFFTSIIHTLLIALGILIAARIWRDGITKNSFFQGSRKPFVIGIAGDSGAGKDTYANAITGILGDHSTVHISGDDYHLWDRHKPMWRALTHLNPMANDLKRFSESILSLSAGKNIMGKHYDHSTGKMSKPFKIRSNDFIIESGLHALYIPAVRECLDLKVYLDIDEGLRRYFKIDRDVNIRGHSLESVQASFQRREPDSIKFIRPQMNHADLCFSLQPIKPEMLSFERSNQHPKLKLEIKSKPGFNELSLYRVLVGICGLHVDLDTTPGGEFVTMTVEGETGSDDIKVAGQILFSKSFDFFDIDPKWCTGLLGVMQLVTLSHIDDRLNERGRL